MKISYHWLSQYIDHQLQPEQVAETLTNTGLEVEEVEQYTTIPANLEDLIIGQVLSVEPHPDADKLKVTTVDVNRSEPLQIICGAPNVAEGQKVVVAPPKSQVTNTNGETLKIKKAKIRGVKSEGMIVSEQEIGLKDDHSGILVLEEEAEVGTSFKDCFSGYEDTVFEIGLTPNRSDAASHIGVARDLAAVLEKPVKHPSVEGFQVDKKADSPSIRIQKPEFCPRYSGLVISGIRVKTSPEWLQNKLKAVGLQPINNVVDVTNYVMMEWGHPLHAFDMGQVKGNEVLIDIAKNGEKFTALDGEERTLDGTELTIRNAEEPMALAGVMGGEASAVNENTTSIFLESAYFDPIAIRKASKKHQLVTDASFRFERGADPQMTIPALKRAALLIRELAGGEISSDVMDEYPSPIEPASIRLEYEYLDNLLGIAIDRQRIRTILEYLGFGIEQTDQSGLTLSVPTFRVDVTRPVDVAEEVIRIYSFNAIAFEPSFKTSLPFNNDLSKEQFQQKLNDYLVSNGFYEMITPPFNGDELARKFPDIAGNEPVNIVNPLSRDQNQLRTSLIFSGLEAVVYNINRGNPDLRLFETGRTYQDSGKGYRENLQLGLFLTGRYHEETWYQEAQPVDFFYLKGVANNILAQAGIQDFRESEENDHAAFAYAMTFEKKKTPIARFGLLKPKLLKHFDIDQPVFFAEIDLEALYEFHQSHQPVFRPISKFPAVIRDLSIKLREPVKFKQVKSLVAEVDPKRLKSVNIFDVYQGDKIEEGFKSYAIRMVFQDETKTLTDEEVDATVNKVMQKLEQDLGGEVRK